MHIVIVQTTRDGWPAAVRTVFDDQPLLLAIVAVLLLAGIGALVQRTRTRRRRRRELRDSAAEAIELLLVAPLPAASRLSPTTPAETGVAEDVAEHTRQVGLALAELGHIGRSETAAAARALREHAVELGRMLEARLRGEGDPNRLEVRITELRERVRGARDRLDAAVGR